MFIRCPQCGQECDIVVEYDTKDFNYTCPYCKEEVVVVKNNQSHSDTCNNNESPSVIVYNQNKKNNTKSTKRWVFFVAIVFLLVLTCPDKNDHKEAIKSKVTTLLNNNNSSDGEILGISLASLLAKGIAELILESSFTVKNYYIFSIGEVYIGGEHKEISFGILKHVFTPGVNQNMISNEDKNSNQENTQPDC